jgi:hypothetical protein
MVQTRVIIFSLLGLARALQFDAQSRFKLSYSQNKSAQPTYGATSSGGYVHFQVCGSASDSFSCQYASSCSGPWTNFGQAATYSAGVWTCSPWGAGATAYCQKITVNGKAFYTSEDQALALGAATCQVWKTTGVNGYCVDGQGRSFDAYDKDGQTLDGCQALCTSIPECVSLTYISRKKRCVIHTANEVPSREPEGGWDKENDHEPGEGKSFFPKSDGVMQTAQCYMYVEA